MRRTGWRKVSGKDDETKQRYPLKVVMVGDGAIGKTSLINSYLESKFKDEYVPTTGARVYSKTIKADDGSAVRMVVWDVPGHRAFTEARTEYYKEASGIVYVFDVTKPETFTNLPRWVDETSRYAPRAKAIIVGNKTDLVDERRVPRKRGERYALKLGAPYFEVSAKSRENVERAFTAMAGLITRITEHALP
jgi:small GTP-binding protein